MNIFLDYETVDLTHPLKADVPTWDGTCGFTISQSGEYSDNSIVENIANAHLLPPQGAYGLVLPLKVVDGSEAPVRFVGLIKKR